MDKQNLKKVAIITAIAILTACGNNEDMAQTNDIDPAQMEIHEARQKYREESGKFNIYPITLEDFANSRDDLILKDQAQTNDNNWYTLTFKRKDGDGKIFAAFDDTGQALAKKEFLAVANFHETRWPDGVPTLGDICLGDSEEETLEKFGDASVSKISSHEAYDVKTRFFETSAGIFEQDEGYRENDAYYYIEGPGYMVIAAFGDGILNDICFRLPH